ncbi:hypothetical protein QA601_00360 [Chitinispirillales bacterium ANBcel5]|uniref:hypothetical protein n=1 Tax=Cellulosispirillum alkaliphilum TaxID=3039283 RepID=UPI002A5799F0|nr:hypothetical protein [Chitinispirillales bacterium ANBcel5]
MLTLVSGLFATVASVIATLRYRKHPALTITPTSVSVIASRLPIEEIDYIELDHPKKIVFWIKDGEYEYKKKLNLKFISKEEHQSVREALQKIKEEIRKRWNGGLGM